MAALSILQWNAQGLTGGHGVELSQLLLSRRNNPYHLVCIQETWFTENRIFNIPNYSCIPRNRKTGERGGCAFFVHNSVYFKNITSHDTLELQSITVHLNTSCVTVVNYYNPCQRLNSDTLDSIFSENLNNNKYLLILGDFNSHSPLWGSSSTDSNGRLIEQYIEDKNIILLNDGSGTRMDHHTGKISCLDLTLATPLLANRCSWTVRQNKLGGDHFPIEIKLCLNTGGLFERENPTERIMN